MEDLEPLLKDIEKLIQKEYGGEVGGVALAFTVPPDFRTVKFISNMSTENAIKIFSGTVDKILAEME